MKTKQNKHKFFASIYTVLGVFLLAVGGIAGGICCNNQITGALLWLCSGVATAGIGIGLYLLLAKPEEKEDTLERLI